MFDWPEHTHTSPTSTSLTASSFFPFTVSCAGWLLAVSGGSLAVHLPEPSAVALAVCPPRVTVTSSLASALPQTGTGMPCWRTMWSPNSGESFTSARALAAEKRRASAARVYRRSAAPARRVVVDAFIWAVPLENGGVFLQLRGNTRDAAA